jgi:pimeloyl-ACP methyl ester carboxylesterase
MTPGAFNRNRRRFLSAAVTILAMEQFGTIGFAAAQATDANAPANGSGASPSFGPLQRIHAGVLDVGYAEVGPTDGRPVVLLHGWPYDIHTYVEVAPLLASAGCRVIVPYLRGYGTTRFPSDATPRNGQQAAIAVDTIALMDALGIEAATVAGCDWGARTAGIVAALWPERCTALVSVSGYLIGSQAAGKLPLPPSAELQWWYQYYFATERGRAGYEKYRRDFARLIWQLASPRWAFDDATFARSAAALDNPDHVAIVVHNYRWRLGLAGRGRATLRRAGSSPGRGTGDRCSDHHPGGRRQRGAAPGPQRLRPEIHGQVRAPDRRGRRWPQSAAGSAAGIRQSGSRRRRTLIGGRRGRDRIEQPRRPRPNRQIAPVGDDLRNPDRRNAPAASGRPGGP